jgi:hypothetical protein
MVFGGAKSTSAQRMSSGALGHSESDTGLRLSSIWEVLHGDQDRPSTVACGALLLPRKQWRTRYVGTETPLLLSYVFGSADLLYLI